MLRCVLQSFAVLWHLLDVAVNTAGGGQQQLLNVSPTVFCGNCTAAIWGCLCGSIWFFFLFFADKNPSERSKMFCQEGWFKMTQSQRAVVGCWGGDSWGEMQEHKVSLQTGATITTWCFSGTREMAKEQGWHSTTIENTGYKNSQVVFSKTVVVVVAVLSIYLSMNGFLINSICLGKKIK